VGLMMVFTGVAAGVGEVVVFLDLNENLAFGTSDVLNWFNCSDMDLIALTNNIQYVLVRTGERGSIFQAMI
jgi:hypothetical protein